MFGRKNEPVDGKKPIDCYNEALQMLESARQELYTATKEIHHLKTEINNLHQQLNKALILDPGTEIVREVHPLALATDGVFVDVPNGDWTRITRTVYGSFEYTSVLPKAQRKYKLVIRNGNNAEPPKGRGDTSKYRLFYTWAKNADNVEYDGELYWGSPDQGGWDVITLKHLANPQSGQQPQKDYWHLEGFIASSFPHCTNRIFNVTLLVIDVID